MFTVSTSLVHPATTYHLDVDGIAYVFGHPTYWRTHAATPNIGMDMNNPWGEGREDAKVAFWEHVAENVVWPASSVIAKEIIEGARLAEIDRAKIAAGHISLFDD